MQLSTGQSSLGVLVKAIAACMWPRNSYSILDRTRTNALHHLPILSSKIQLSRYEKGERSEHRNVSSLLGGRPNRQCRILSTNILGRVVIYLPR